MANHSSADYELWVRSFHPSSPGAPRLLFLPHAGGSASFYFPYSAALSPGIDVLVAQYPGRQDRYAEPCAESVESLADALLRVLDDDGTPLALFGHSMGSVVGFELARRLEAEGRPPAVFFASGRRGPSITRVETVHRRDDAGVLAEIEMLNGTDVELLRDPELMEMVMPSLRADYRAVETYRYVPGQRLSCPIVAITGDADPRATPGEVGAWAEETSGVSELLVHPGGHFYLVPERDAVNAQVAAHMRSFVPQAGAVT